MAQFRNVWNEDLEFIEYSRTRDFNYILNDFYGHNYIGLVNSQTFHEQALLKITDKGKKVYEHHKANRDEKAISADDEKMFKWYEKENAKQKFDDYPIQNKQRNWLFVIAIIEAIIIIGLFLKC